MKDRNYLAIVNPNAGGGLCGKKARKILQEWLQCGLNLKVLETKAPGDALHIAQQAYRDGQNNFISAGGDGTSYEIINGLMPVLDKTRTPSLGFLPAGTGNSFIKDFSCNPIVDCWQAIQNHKTTHCDIIKLSHEDGTLYYMNILSIGFTADIGRFRNQYFSHFGHLGYIMAVLFRLIKLKSYPYLYQINNEITQNNPSTFISFNNSRYTGGNMLMAPNADTNDGLVDVIRMKATGRLKLLSAFPKIFTGGHLHFPFIEEAKTDNITFYFKNPIDIMIDGEIVKIKPTQLTVLPRKMRLLI